MCLFSSLGSPGMSFPATSRCRPLSDTLGMRHHTNRQQPVRSLAMSLGLASSDACLLACAAFHVCAGLDDFSPCPAQSLPNHISPVELQHGINQPRIGQYTRPLRHDRWPFGPLFYLTLLARILASFLSIVEIPVASCDQMLPLSVNQCLENLYIKPALSTSMYLLFITQHTILTCATDSRTNKSPPAVTLYYPLC